MKHKVLFLASWYPSKILPLSGIFVKRHAESVANFCDVAVLHVIQDPNLNDKKIEIETENEKNVFTVRVFYKDNGKEPNAIVLTKKQHLFNECVVSPIIAIMALSEYVSFNLEIFCSFSANLF